MEVSILMEDVKKQILGTPLLRVLDLLLQYPNVALSDAEINSKIEGVKRAAVHMSLTRLAGMGLISRTHQGRRCFNEIDLSNSWLQPFKLACNMLEIEPIIKLLKPHTLKIVLFGSRAESTNSFDSDFDLAVVANEPDVVQRLAADSSMIDRIQLMVKTPSEMLDLESSEPVFASKIRKGIVLWEK